MRKLRKLSCILLLASGCGSPNTGDDDDKPAPTMDAGFADVGAEPSCEREVAPPQAPDAPDPVVWSCPDGWREEEGGCSPWPADGPARCEDGEAHFPGTAGCAPIGTECPARAFGEPPPEYAGWSRLYVDRSADPGGDGSSPETPLTSLGAAVLMADGQTETVVLLARGEFPVSPTLPIPNDTVLWGACVRDTIIRTSTTSNSTSVLLGTISPNAVLGNLTIRANTVPIAALGEGTDLHLIGVMIDGGRAAGAAAQDGAFLRAERLVVRNIQRRIVGAPGIALQNADGVFSQIVSYENQEHGLILEGAVSATITDASFADNGMGGLFVRHGSRLAIDRSVIDGNTAFGVHVEGGALVGQDVVVSDTHFLDDLSAGRGVAVTLDGPTSTMPGSIELTRTLIAGNERSGVTLFGAGSSARLTDVIVRDTKRNMIADDSSDGGGYGVLLNEGTRAFVQRVLMERNFNAGIIAVDPGTELEGSDVVITDTGQGFTTAAVGLSVLRSASASLARVEVHRSQGAGIGVSGAAVVHLEHVTVRDSKVLDFGDGGVGLAIADPGTTAVIDRARFEHNEWYGVVAQEMSTMELTDVAVVDTQSKDGVFGLGLAINDGSHVRGTRIALEDNRGAGIVCAQRSTLELEDLAVRRTQVAVSGLDSPIGRGMSLEDSSTATLTRALFDENHEVAVFAGGASRLALIDVSILRTGPIDVEFGRGLQVQGRSRGDLERVCIAGNQEVGILAYESELFGRDVVVLDTAHNLCFDQQTCDAPGGIGIYSGNNGRIALSGFLLAGNVETGVTVSGEADLINGTITGSALGADIRNPEFNTVRITETVVYTGNEENGVATRDTPLPSTDTVGLY